MDKNIFEFADASSAEAGTETGQVSEMLQLSDLHLALVGGGIGDTVL